MHHPFSLKQHWYHILLLVIILGTWLWAAIDPVDRTGWFLENILIFIFIPIFIIAARYFKFSNLSYGLITIFMVLHIIGSHYTYSLVPFGYQLQEWFGADRNMYDRLVHFTFGLLLAYPMREVFTRVAEAKGIWGFFFPVEMTLALSAIYEIVEWLTVLVVDPGAGAAFLGTQGDEFDPIKDMALAGIGAMITMFIAFIVRIAYDRKFIKEIIESLKPKIHVPMGEVLLGKLRRKR